MSSAVGQGSAIHGAARPRLDHRQGGQEVGAFRTTGNAGLRGHKAYRKRTVVEFVPALKRPRCEISVRFLSLEERIGIAGLQPCEAKHEAGRRPDRGRAPSPVSRELSRNASDDGHQPSKRTVRPPQSGHASISSAERQTRCGRSSHNPWRNDGILSGSADICGSGSLGTPTQHRLAVDNGQQPLPATIPPGPLASRLFAPLQALARHGCCGRDRNPPCR